MIPLLIKAKAVYEWFNFAGEAISALGVIKRAAAATAGAAVIAGAGVGVVKTVEVVTQSPQERAVKAAIATHVPDITPELREQVMKVNSQNTYSKTFLYKEQNRPLLLAIVAICEDGNALPALQCDDASEVKAFIERQELMAKEDEIIREKNRKFIESINTDGLIPR